MPVKCDVSKNNSIKMTQSVPFTIFVVGGGLLIMNKVLTKDPAYSSSWLDDSQTRLKNLRGNRHANINLAHIISYWDPIQNPRRWRATHTFSKRVKARTDAYSTEPKRRARGAGEISKYNYRIGGGVGPHPRLYSKWG